MPQDQLSIFKQKSVGKPVVPRQLAPVAAPTGQSSIMQTLPAYRAHLRQRYAAKTVSMYYGDVRELSVYLTGRALQDIQPQDLEQWVARLTEGASRPALERKTLNRKLSAVINYFAWLHNAEAITDDPAAGLMNARVQSPLPDYLYADEIRTLYEAASKDPRTYLLVLLLLETGIKSKELFTLRRSHFDLSDKYRPEL